MLNSFDPEVWPADAWDLLSPQATSRRREKMLRVASLRTPFLRLTLQDVHDPHNIGACLRSAEAFGILNVDLVNAYQEFGKPSSVARGARQWLDLHKFDNLALYSRELKARGYRLAAAYPSAGELTVDQLPIDQPLAVVFGNERAGLHADWSELVDYRFTIPMYGMVESYNISVSVALTLFSLNQRCRATIPAERFQLSEAERRNLLNRWACQQSQQPLKELQRLRTKAHS